MQGRSIPQLCRHEKRRLQKAARKCVDARLKTRYLIILNLAAGHSVTQTAETLHVSRKTVQAVARRYRKEGESGLADRREGNGEQKLTEYYLGTLHAVVESSPLDHGWKRPTWTREMLVETLVRKTGVRIHVSTMSRALKLIGARRGQPKPTVESTWSTRAKHKRLKQIKEMLAALSEDDEAFYEDEVDVHLNPKIGLDWMVCGQQKKVLTPGQNEKRYMAGAENYRTGETIWVESDTKNTYLFLQLLWKLTQRYPNAKTIHVIIDNYRIHDTVQVTLALQTEQGRRIQLHHLPPYCPDHNKIERTWQDLHANVTRNHCCSDMQELMCNVRYYLRKRNRRKHNEFLQKQRALAG